MAAEEKWDLIVKWRIENFICYGMESGSGYSLISPVFTVAAFDNSQWHLFLLPGGWIDKHEDYFCWALLKKIKNVSKEKSDTIFRFVISAANQEVIRSAVFHQIFENGDCVYDGRLKHEVLETLEKCLSGTLIIECYLKRNDDSEKLSLRREFRTNMLSHKCTFEWKVKFHKHSQNIKGKSIFWLGDQFLRLNIAILREDVIVTVRKIKQNTRRDVVIGRVTLVNLNGREEYVTEAKFKEVPWSHSVIKKTDLISNVCKYVKDGNLLFICDFSIVNVKWYKPDLDSKCHTLDCLMSLRKDFRTLLAEKTNFDLKLVAENNIELQTHRSILAARSPVFCAMFRQEMIENRTSVVNIVDFDSETLKYFLEFLYTGFVHSMDSEKATNLLIVADKYNVKALEELCSNFLMSVLSEHNVCEILTIADMIAHENLKNAALQFGAHQISRIVSNSYYSEWVKENSKLCAEIKLHSENL